MNETHLLDASAIEVDEVFPHSPQVVWKTLTTSDLIGRWLMVPSGFEPVEGACFTFQTTPAGAWDGVIHCEVCEVIPFERLSYRWHGGDDRNVGYGSRLESVVTWTLSVAGGGTRLRLVHSGFVLPRNESAYKTMTNGWSHVIRKIGAIADEQA